MPRIEKIDANRGVENNRKKRKPNQNPHTIVLCWNLFYSQLQMYQRPLCDKHYFRLRWWYSIQRRCQRLNDDKVHDDRTCRTRKKKLEQNNFFCVWRKLKSLLYLWNFLLCSVSFEARKDIFGANKFVQFW